MTILILVIHMSIVRLYIQSKFEQYPIEVAILSSKIKKKKLDKSVNFYPVIINLVIPIGIVRLHIQSKFEPCRSH